MRESGQRLMNATAARLGAQAHRRRSCRKWCVTQEVVGSSPISVTLNELAPRLALEPGTCGLTVRPGIARKAASVNDLDQNGG
jgi:hypothetical protein